MLTHFLTWSKERYVGMAVVVGMLVVAVVLVLSQSILALVPLLALLWLVFSVATRENILNPAPHPIMGEARPARTTSHLQRNQQHIITPDGQLRTAWAVPLEQSEPYAMVMTTDGYMITDSSGQVVHVLKPTK